MTGCTPPVRRPATQSGVTGSNLGADRAISQAITVA